MSVSFHRILRRLALAGLTAAIVVSACVDDPAPTPCSDCRSNQHLHSGNRGHRNKYSHFGSHGHPAPHSDEYSHSSTHGYISRNSRDHSHSRTCGYPYCLPCIQASVGRPVQLRERS